MLSNSVKNSLEQNYARFLVPLYFLIYPPTLLKIIRKDFAT